MKQRIFSLLVILLLAFSAMVVTLLAQQKNQLASMENDLFEKEMALAITQKEVRHRDDYEKSLRQEIGSVNQESKREMLAYLTFDDGPSSVTPKVLDILKEKDVPAVFFINGANVRRSNRELLRRAVAEGHLIGNHTYSHQYDSIYSSPESFMADLLKNEKLIMDLTETRSMLVRFPGGSHNSISATAEGEAIMGEIRSDLKRLGYIYIDWNLAANSDQADQVVAEIEGQLFGRQRVTILLHDRGDREVIVEALPIIIDRLREKGYTFVLIDPSKDMVRF